MRKIPSTHGIQTLDETPKLEEAQAFQYRAALGYLLYIALKRPDCQHAFSLLARNMTAPTEKQMKNLKYLAEYMYATRDYTLVLRWTTLGRSYLDQGIRERPSLLYDGSGSNSDTPAKQSRLLEAVNDNDWAGGSDRRSLSCGHLYLDGNLMFSYTRRQTIVSLSSCETELISSTGAIVELIFLKT